MLTWMVYVVTVSVFLCGAALAAEYQARLRRTATRWIWIAVIVASLLIPTVIASVSVQMPAVFDVSVSPKVVAIREVTTSRLSPASWLAADSMYQAKVHNWDPILRDAWLTASGLMLAALVASGVMLFRRIRTWRLETLAGTQVYVADTVGPAVVGLLRSRIVVPAWLLSAPQSQQSAVIAHEQSHLEAGDPLMLTIALGLLVLMPWNFPLWWQLRRLRRAIEVDCDSRVLRRGIDRRSYGATLLDVGARQSGYIGSVAAMSESRSFLEQRIKLIMSTSTKRWQLLGAGLGLVSLALFAVAAEVSPPNADPVEVKVPASVLDDYVGYYQFNGKLVEHITRTGDQLYAQMTGQPPAEIYPSSSNEFFFKVVKAQITFEKEGSGPATALIAHQNGAENRMPRIDAGRAQQLQAELKARIDAQTPVPGSEAALRMLIEGHISNNLPYSRMSPQLAKAAREQLPRTSQVFKQLGALKSIEFKGVGAMGWDDYTVKFENGTMDYRINLADDGTVVGALMTMSP
jgi:beta-lactamase regulating signal transducer with metallopeptidase domain